MPFNLFHRKKQPEKAAMASKEESKQEASEPVALPAEETKPEPVDLSKELKPEVSAAVQKTQEEIPTPAEQKQETAFSPPTAKLETTEPASKTYLKAMPLRELSDIEKVKNEVMNGNIIILRVTPLASKSIEDVKKAVNELFQFSEFVGGDIARLGEERVVVCPKSVRIWREKTVTPVSNKPLPTVA
jgi:SepF-like predicted cell division protein (DUF552 family)